RRETIAFDRNHTLTLKLEEGRRSSADTVPPPAANQRPKKTAEISQDTLVLNKLRALADPESTGSESSSRSSGLTSLVAQSQPRGNIPPAKANSPDNILFYQTKVSPMAANGFDFTAQATVSPDGSTTWVKLSPVFESLNRGASTPAVVSPLIPG